MIRKAKKNQSLENLQQIATLIYNRLLAIPFLLKYSYKI